MITPASPSSPAEQRSLFGHRRVSLRRHALAVLAASLAIGLFAGASAAVGFCIQGTGGSGFSFAFWGVWIMILLMTLAALPLAAIAFTLARAILVRLRLNFGLAYACVGLLTGVLAMRAADVPADRLPLLMGEAALDGIAAGLAYWLVAVHGGTGHNRVTQGPDPVSP